MGSSLRYISIDFEGEYSHGKEWNGEITKSLINVDSKKVTRGRDDILVTNNYKLQFVIGKSDNKDTCPNCGAKITNNTSGVCEYCGSHVVIKPKNYVLNKKTIIK